MGKAMRVFLRVCLTALITIGVVSGCGSSEQASSNGSTSPTETTVSGEVVAYVDQVCSAVAAFTTVPKTPPSLENTNPDKLKNDMATYLGQMADAYNTSANKLNQIGPAPIQGGKEQVDRLAELFTQAANSFSDAKTKLEQSNANDPSGGLQAAVDAINQLGDYTVPFKEIQSSNEFREAALIAPNCQGLRAGPTSSSPPTTT